MKHLMLIILSTFVLVSCNAQTGKKQNKDKTEISKEKIKPEINYRVNKEYDEEGNLIRLDSTYTYYYSNIDKNAMMDDSIFKKFNEYFSRTNSFDHSLFDDFFKQDNYLEDDFFKQDFFRGNLKRNQEMMNRMLQRMDSLKNKFFIDEFPLEEQRKSSKDKK